MLQISELMTKAECYDRRAEMAQDLRLKTALRLRARESREIAAELEALHRDPAYRAIHQHMSSAAAGELGWRSEPGQGT